LEIESDYKYFFFYDKLKVSFPKIDDETLHSLPLIFHRTQGDVVLASTFFKHLLGFGANIQGVVLGYNKEDLILFEHQSASFTNLLGEEKKIEVKSDKVKRGERKLKRAISFFDQHLSHLKEYTTHHLEDEFILELLAVRMYTEFITRGVMPSKDLTHYDDFIKDSGESLEILVDESDRDELSIQEKWEEFKFKNHT